METKYYINKEKGVVVCKITIQDRWTEITYTGKARCLPEDTFDEELGKRIANTRAHIIMHQDNLQRSSKEAGYHWDLYCEAIEDGAKTYDKISGLKGKLYKLTGKEIPYLN